MIIDTHSHIYLAEFDVDRESMLMRAENEGINLILMPAVDQETYLAMLKVEKEFSEKSHSMMGLHPCSVKEGYKQELKIAEEYLEKRRFVAVGETGLDFYWDKTFTKEQYESFQTQIEWAKHYDIPVVIHSRNSIDECISTIKENQQGNLKGVFHCFSGDERPWPSQAPPSACSTACAAGAPRGTATAMPRDLPLPVEPRRRTARSERA